MIKIKIGAMVEAQLAHQGLARFVLIRCVGNKPLAVRRHPEPIQARLRRFKSVSASPIGLRNSPTNLDIRTDRGALWPACETGEAKERAIVLALKREKAKPVSLKMGLNPVDQRVALFARHLGLEVLHDARIRVHNGKGRAILFPPSS